MPDRHFACSVLLGGRAVPSPSRWAQAAAREGSRRHRCVSCRAGPVRPRGANGQPRRTERRTMKARPRPVDRRPGKSRQIQKEPQAVPPRFPGRRIRRAQGARVLASMQVDQPKQPDIMQEDQRVGATGRMACRAGTRSVTGQEPSLLASRGPVPARNREKRPPTLTRRAACVYSALLRRVLRARRVLSCFSAPAPESF